MQKIGLAVVTYKDNFGSALQTYATQTIVEQLGFSARIFDISKVHSDINKRKIKFYLKRVFYPDEFKYLLETLRSRKKLKNNSQSDYSKNMVIRHKKYKLFNSMFLKFFPVADSWNDLTSQSKECDCVLVGSDQLWRPSNIAGGFYTLEFVPSGIKKVSYATSFGVSILPKSLFKTTNNFLQKFDCISVREETGKQIIRKVSNLEVPVVCDPTMLLTQSQWLDIQTNTPLIKGDYILTYFLGDNPLHREFVRKMKQKTGFRIVSLLHGAVYIPSDDGFPDEAPYDVGPCEFINLIRFSKFVCTDSFHGTVFSILNSKDFFSFRRFNDKSEFSTNDRIKTLLNWTELNDRLLCGSEDIDTVLYNKIDYSHVLQLVKSKREESLAFLKKALEEQK